MTTYTDPTIIQLGDKPRINPSAWIVVAAGVISLIGAAVFFVDTGRVTADTNSINANITVEQNQLVALKPTADSLVLLDQQAKDLHALFDNQKQWVSVLGTLEQRWYKNMVVTSLQVDDKGAISFAGSTPTYSDYAKIYDSLTDSDGSKYFATVVPSTITKVLNSTTNVPMIQFAFSLTLRPKILTSQAILQLSDLTTTATAH